MIVEGTPEDGCAENHSVATGNPGNMIEIQRLTLKKFKMHKTYIKAANFELCEEWLQFVIFLKCKYFKMQILLE